MQTQLVQPIRIDQYSGTEMLIEWNNGERFAVPFKGIRFMCPCAACVDEHSGRRTLQRSSIPDAIKPTFLQAIGRYALGLHWSDGHQTGIYHFDFLHDVCGAEGKRI